MADLLFFAGLVIDVREKDWREGLYLESIASDEKFGPHDKLKRWFKRKSTGMRGQDVRSDQDDDIMCDMWWDHTGDRCCSFTRQMVAM